jgi:hypothetical protein
MLRITPRTLVSNVAAAFRGLVRDRARLALTAGIVHRDVETAKARDGAVDQSADLILLADVAGDELGFGTEGAQLLGERLADLITPPGDNHFCALLGKGDRGRAPDAAQCPCNQNNLSVHVARPPRYGHRIERDVHAVNAVLRRPEVSCPKA